MTDLQQLCRSGKEVSPPQNDGAFFFGDYTNLFDLFDQILA